MTHTGRPNKPYRSRTYIVDCKVCFQWHPVPSLEVQEICREAGACPDCIRDDFYRLRIRIAAIEQRLIEITKIGQALPEGERGTMRELYARKTRQLADARAQLVALQQIHEGVPA